METSKHLKAAVCRTEAFIRALRAENQSNGSVQMKALLPEHHTELCTAPERVSEMPGLFGDIPSNEHNFTLFYYDADRRREALRQKPEKMEFSVLPVKALRLALRLGWKWGRVGRTAATQVQRCPIGISTAPCTRCWDGEGVPCRAHLGGPYRTH